MCAVLGIALFVGPLAFIQGSTLSGEGLVQGPNITGRGRECDRLVHRPLASVCVASGVNVAEPGHQALFPGLFKLLFAGVGLLYGLRRRHLNA